MLLVTVSYSLWFAEINDHVDTEYSLVLLLKKKKKITAVSWSLQAFALSSE